MPSLLDNPAAAQSTLWAIVLLPLVGALVNGLFGRRLGRGNVALIALAMVGGSFALSVIAFSWVANGVNLRFAGDLWFGVTGLDGRMPVSVPWGLFVDRLSGTMLLVVTGVGFLIHVYSTGYMSHEDDAGYARFFTYLNLFVAAMLIARPRRQPRLTFVGWEGVGLCIYLLIGFWYTDPEKAYAGRKAFVVNRIGDFGFLLGVFALLSVFGTTDYGRLSSDDPRARHRLGPHERVFAGWTVRAALTFATLGLFIGAAGKSAQLPLYVWLPDAMAGPTPVSALIHAATMVTAGVYLVARTNFLFALAPASMATVAFVGAATALFAAAIAFAQNDMKKVLAYSTVSQLGYMFIGVGVGAFSAGIYHLVTHAFFKACLFLGAGSGHARACTTTSTSATWAACGRRCRRPPGPSSSPPSPSPASSRSRASSRRTPSSPARSRATTPPWPAVGTIAYVLGTLAAAGTAFYMTRAFALAFMGKPRTDTAEHAHESPPAMTVPLWILAFLSVVAARAGAADRGRRAPPGRALRAVHRAGLRRRPTRCCTCEERRGGSGPTRSPGWWPSFPAGSAGRCTRGACAGSRTASSPPSRGFYRLVADKFRVDELYDAIVAPAAQGAAPRCCWRSSTASPSRASS